MKHTPNSTRLARAITYAILYSVGMVLLYGAGVLVSAVLTAMGWFRIDPGVGMLISAALLALGYLQAGKQGEQHD